MRFWQAVAFLPTDQLLDVARAADELGFHGIMISDHVFFPKDLQSAYPYSPTGAPVWEPSTPWPDPWVLAGAITAVTTRLHVATNIYIAAARNPFVVAKMVGTAAVLSGNRVELGVGAGWMKEEFDQLGQDFHTRGKRLDEMIEVLRALWRGGMVEHHGQHYDFPPVEMSPAPTVPVPIYGGGHSAPALRRAARLCDGWIGNAYTLEGCLDYVGRMKAELAAAGRTGEAFEIVVAVLAMPDVDLFRQLEEAGVTGLLCAPWMTTDIDPTGGATADYGNSLEFKRRALEQFAETIIAEM